MDGQRSNLYDFGTYEYVLPTIGSHPFPVREVFMKFTDWDIVLTDLQPGVHSLRGLVSDDVDFYRWDVKLVIEDRNVSE